jgi:hypothetical protein
LNKRGKLISITAIICIVITIVLFFLLISNRNTAQWVGFLTLLVAELLLFGGMICLEQPADNSSQIILRTVNGFSIIAFPTISIIVSIIYIALKPVNFKLFTLVQILLLAAMVILYFIGSHVASYVKESNTELLAAESRILNIKDTLIQFSMDKSNSEYKVLLEKVAEEIRFSDTSTTVPADDEIKDCLTKLELALLRDVDNKNVEVTDILQNMLLLVKKRKTEVKNTKSGGV